MGKRQQAIGNAQEGINSKGNKIYIYNALSNTLYIKICHLVYRIFKITREICKMVIQYYALNRKYRFFERSAFEPAVLFLWNIYIYINNNPNKSDKV